MRLVVALGGAVALTLVLNGCGSSGLTASSTCRDSRRPHSKNRSKQFPGCPRISTRRNTRPPSANPRSGSIAPPIPMSRSKNSSRARARAAKGNLKKSVGKAKNWKPPSRSKNCSTASRKKNWCSEIRKPRWNW